MPESTPDRRVIFRGRKVDLALQPVVIAWDEAVRMACDGTLEDAKSMLAILLCDRLRRGG